MYDFYYETLLEDSSKFSAVEGIQNTVIEFLNSNEVSMPRRRRRTNVATLQHSKLTDYSRTDWHANT